MLNVLVTGAGKIGSLIAVMLAQSGDYRVTLADVDLSGADVTRVIDASRRGDYPQIAAVTLDVTSEAEWQRFLADHPTDAVISSLPFHVNVYVARMCREHGLHYFDLTEDTSVTATVKELASGARSAFVPQCGLAPGFISIAANSLMKGFDELETVKLRVGALPQRNSNALHYALTWSTEGVINEYGNLCHAIRNYEDVLVNPLEGLECVLIDGMTYEAFNTSGGLGSLNELYHGKVKHLNYKTLRYPGHCEKMKMLMNDLRLNEDRDTLKRILEKAIPKTYQDVVVVYTSVSGMRDGTYLEDSYAKKVYPQALGGLNWSAIQMSTASGVCAVADMLLTTDNKRCGLVYQENFTLDDFLANRFGAIYQQTTFTDAGE